MQGIYARWKLQAVRGSKLGDKFTVAGITAVQTADELTDKELQMSI